MKKLILIIVLFLPFIASAQKLQKPTIDKLTGDTTWTTSREKLFMHGNYLTGQGEVALCFLRAAKGSKDLIINLQVVNKSNFPSMLTGSKAYFKLADNSTIPLTCAANDYHISGSDLAVAGSAYGLYTLTANDIAKLTSSDLTFLRVETTSGNFDCDIKPKNAEMFKKQFALIAGH
ncbi:hypothetical protein [Mucilaginibacter glaciei]|uniref:Uncharacterized protein n=1 Tax=Mucilaginibacter glaciei TaxID=2772109 RepID=A0A926NIE4_9SPHI|nr:hypothetical protein [Mucilaginibacter glaciei]MBD1392654.1 hypothetical protein [Mucilaginibacter glaciei]